MTIEGRDTTILSTTINDSNDFPMSKPKRTPLPKFQLFIVFLIQFAEPITGTVIYPFINQFVRDTGVTHGDERKTGYYAGAIESTFYIAEALTVVYWGRASDRFGRRPVLLLGPLGLSLAMLSFGFARNYGTLVLSRCMQGVFNGNIGVSKVVIGEITDSTNAADAFALMPIMWTIGITIAPMLGGSLAQPAKTWPEIFGKFAFFDKYPYFLPCAISAFIAGLSSLIAFMGLKETLPSAIIKEKREAAGLQITAPDSTTALLSEREEHGYAATEDVSTLESSAQSQETQDLTPPPLRALLTPQVLLFLVIYGFMTFGDMSTLVLQPLLYSTSISLGGLGFDPNRIGTIMASWGLVNAIFQFFCLAWLLRRFGARRIQIFAHFGFCVVLSLYPVLKYLAQRAGGADTLVWTVIIVQLTFALSTSAAYASVLMLILDNAPSRASLGAINGMAQAVGCIARGIAPTVASSLFSVSLEKRLASGNMVFIILLGISCIGLRLAFLLPKPAI